MKRLAPARGIGHLLPSLAAFLLLVAALPSSAAPTPDASPRLAWQAAATEAGVSLPPGVTRVASVEGITEYRLDNGLRVLLFPDPSKQQITVNITYLVGSLHEGYGETGMAHLLEHLVFKGTPDHPDIPQELTERGALPNGTTWFDRTNYFETFSASGDNLEWALDLEADRMVNSFIAKEDLESEMTVVRNEWEAGENSPFSVLMKRTMSAAFQWHNYGNATIGARADIENVPIERLQAFYRKYYQPDNAVLVVAGRFDEQTALDLVADRFGRIPRPERQGANRLWNTYTAEPAQDGERTVTLRRVGDTQMAMAVYHVPPGSHPDFAAVDVLAHVLGNQPSGRLYKTLVEGGIAARASTFARQLREPGVLMAFTEVRPDGDLDAATEAMLEVIESVPQEPLTEEEVERARTELLKNIDLTFRESRRIALSLSEWAAMGDWRLFFLHRDRIEEVTAEDVTRVAEAYLLPSNRTVGQFVPVEEAPRRAEVPEPPDVEAMVTDYAGGEGMAEGEAFDPTAENVEARTSRQSLPSGFEFALLPKENRGDTVTLSFALRFGDEESLRGKAAAASMAGGMLMRGTQQRSRQELNDELDRLQASGGIGGGVMTASGRFETVRDNLPAVLRLIGEILHQPAFDEKDWQLLKEERLASLESQLSEPGPRAFRAFNRALNDWPPDHPHYTPTLEEELERLEAVTLEEARTFYEEFYGAGSGTLALVGDFDPAEIEPILQEIFGGWQSDPGFERIADPYRPVEPDTEVIETPDKANAFFLAGQPIQMTDEHPDYPAMVLANYMLGGGFLNSRLATRVRQEEGLSYSIGSSFGAHPIDDSASFTVYAIYAPENANQVEAAIREEIARALADGFTPDEVEAAKDGYLQQQQVRRAQDNVLAGELSSGLYFDRTLDWDAELESRIAALTPDDIVAAMRRHLDPDGLVVVKAGDFPDATGGGSSGR